MVMFLERLERRLYASARHIVTVGEGYRRQLEARGVQPARISVITNGRRPDRAGHRHNAMDPCWTALA